ncbi:substrate-binding domain-containing protein [Bacillus lacus]|uniref:Substrate-binding domain-containing protein n=1 Tax=Metabacillus lacus TaxID=1983721 RepID=A0A7X2J015_9BACI|nr:substrate-binding domain-containing protein [Metabacillus lacus]
MFKRSLYSIALALFLVTSALTIYFGKETFHFNTPPAGAESPPAYHFVLIPEELDNDYWHLVEQGAREAARHLHVHLEYLGPKQADLEEHLKTIDMAIAGKVDGIMTQAINDGEFSPLIKKAGEKGIPLVTIDTDAPGSSRKAYIGTDNYYAGFLAGKALLTDTEGEQFVGIVTGRLEAAHQKLRVQGFRDAVEHEKRVQILDVKESNITKIGAVEAAYGLLKAHPQITALYGTSALDGSGMAQVVERLRTDNPPYVIAFDTLPETISYLESGLIDATIVQYPYKMGYRAVQSLVALQEGKKLDELQHTETTVLRKENLPFSPLSQRGEVQ